MSGRGAIDLDRALIVELLRAWTDHNARDFGGAMRAPVLDLHDAGPLGRWMPDRRWITLRRSLAYEAPWGQVIEVLRHEMAHQYVAEVLRIDEPPHGPAFQRLCAKAGIDARAAGMPAQGDASLDRLLRKVRGLLALAESPNPHEAQAAARTARRLLAEHDLSLTEAPGRYTFEQIGPTKQRFQLWEKLIATVLSRHFGVRAIYASAYLPRDRAWGRVLEIAGTPQHVAVASYVHDALRSNADASWRQHRKRRRLRSNANRMTFYAGLMDGFLGSLDREREESPGTALVPTGDPALDRWFSRRYPSTRKMSGGSIRDPDALEAGRAAGRELSIRPGVGASGEGPRLLTRRD